MGSKLEVKSNCPEFETFIITTTGALLTTSSSSSGWERPCSSPRPMSPPPPSPPPSTPSSTCPATPCSQDGAQRRHGGDYGRKAVGFEDPQEQVQHPHWQCSLAFTKAF